MQEIEPKRTKGSRKQDKDLEYNRGTRTGVPDEEQEKLYHRGRIRTGVPQKKNKNRCTRGRTRTSVPQRKVNYCITEEELVYNRGTKTLSTFADDELVLG